MASDVKLTADDISEMRKLHHNPKHGGSDRRRDKQRARLKRLGFIAFDRAAWEWTITPAGSSALENSQ